MSNSRFSNRFGSDGENLFRGDYFSERRQRQRESTASDSSDIQKRIDQNREALFFSVVGTLCLSGAILGFSFLSWLNQRHALRDAIMRACNLSPEVGAKSTYEHSTKDGVTFPHAVVTSAVKDSYPFIVFKRDSQSPAHIFRDTNQNDFIDDFEKMHVFERDSEAQSFLKLQIQTINQAE